MLHKYAETLAEANATAGVSCAEKAEGFVEWLETKYDLSTTPMYDYELDELLGIFLEEYDLPREKGILQEAEAILLDKYEKVWREL